jgi:hypothetical protein
VVAVRDREANVDSAKRERRFKFRGGVPCLDFVNTVAWRLTDRPVEYLGSYEDLLAWGRQAGLLAPEETEVLSGWAATHPEEARATLSRAVALREAVHRVLSAAIAGEPQDEGALSTLNRELSEALSRLRVAPAAGDAYVWAWERGGEGDGGPRRFDDESMRLWSAESCGLNRSGNSSLTSWRLRNAPRFRGGDVSAGSADYASVTTVRTRSAADRQMATALPGRDPPGQTPGCRGCADGTPARG